MSYSIDGNKITVTCGDSVWIDLNINDGVTSWQPDDEDELIFTLKDADGETALEVELPAELNELYLTPEQTATLKPGYEYQYEVTFNDAAIMVGFLTCERSLF